MLGVLAVLGSSACVTDAGWTLAESRSCAPKAAPRVCVMSEPDHGHVVEIGDARLIPGECVAAEPGRRGGLARVRSVDRQRGRRGRHVSTRRGRATLLEVDAEGKIDASRVRCDREPVSLDSARVE